MGRRTTVAEALRRLRRARYEPRDGGPDRQLPVPWIIATNATTDEPSWLDFDPDRAARAHRRRRCQVCGLVVTGTLVHLRVGDNMTSGPGTHPICALIALRLCPHFGPITPHDIIGWTWDRPGQGYGANGASMDEILESETPMRPGAVPITIDQLRRMAKR